jgi:ATP-dependent exoDNAse (exonuclease V) alpha subunit
MGSSFDKETFLEERTRLYENLFPNRFFVLSGNPGSGKSYEILNIINHFIKNKETYLLLAPTGKAVLRLKFDEDFKETEIEAMTIDKFIYQFKHHPGKRKKYNNVIVDESSMVDLLKLRDLLRCIVADDPGLHRLILVGDVHQLPPIGFGKPFFDIIQYLRSDGSLIDHFIELDVNCRQELSGNVILDLCKLFINEGELSDDQIKKLSDGGTITKGFKVRYWDSEEKLDSLLEEEWLNLSKQLKCKGSSETKLDQLFEIDLNVEKAEDIQYDMERFQVITPYRYFADKINLYFQSKVRSSHEIEILKLFKSGDKIIRTRNFYTKEGLILSNGSIGLAATWHNEKLLCFPELKEKILKTHVQHGIRESEKDFFELAYGITVHKAQGSGFEHLIVILPKRYGLLCKELFYTALSRSKKDITILIEGESGVDFEDSLFEFARKRTFTENRKTSLLLDNPYRSYGLEPEKNVFVQSREEQIIYRHLMDFRSKYSETEGFYFEYEKFPVVDDKKIRIKTDFTIYTRKGTFYWEHLGMLTKKSYKKTWLNVKRPTYEKAGLLHGLITTDNLNGISDDKIISIIQGILDNNIGNEDRTRLYSNHHFSLR